MPTKKWDMKIKANTIIIDSIKSFEFLVNNNAIDPASIYGTK